MKYYVVYREKEYIEKESSKIKLRTEILNSNEEMQEKLLAFEIKPKQVTLTIWELEPESKLLYKLAKEGYKNDDI